MAINKVVLGNQTLIDITDTTATAGTIVQGYSAYGANGVKVSGSFDPSIYVEKAGDTMTGSLNINGTNAIISEHIKHIDATQPYQYNYSEEAYTLMDTNTVKLGSIIGKLNTDGATGIGIGTSKTVEGLLHTNNLYIMMDNSGNALIEMTQPAAWRNALGLGNTSGALPIANGGTGATTKADAKTALDIDDLEDALDNAKFVNKTISGSNGTVAYTFSSNCAFIIFISGPAAGLRSTIYGYCTATGSVSVTQTNASSSTSISTTTTTNKLTIKNAGSNACYATLMRLTGTTPT